MVASTLDFLTKLTAKELLAHFGAYAVQLQSDHGLITKGVRKERHGIEDIEGDEQASVHKGLKTVTYPTNKTDWLGIHVLVCLLPTTECCS